VLATNSPIIRTIGLDLGEFQLSGELPASADGDEMCAPRRTVLDKLLLDTAATAGAEIREGFTVTGLDWADGRVTGIRGGDKNRAAIVEKARIVVGADGRNSLVAREAGAEAYHVRPVLTCVCYAYWRNVAPHTPAIHPLPRRVVISFPTNDGLVVTPVVFAREDLAKVRTGLDHHLRQALGQVAALTEPFDGAPRVERIRATADLPNFFRKPFGDGWALVGDAGYHKDPILGQGISDAFRSAEWLAEALHAGLSGAQPLSEALADYQRVRDEHFRAMYDLNCDMAGLQPPPPELQALYHALRDNPVERSRYFGTLGGTVPIPDFYARENLRRITSGAAAPA
jgi:flavin-dependent dehydrogenase